MALARRTVLVWAVWTLATAAAWAGGVEWMAPLPEGVELEVPQLASEVPAPATVLGAPLGQRFSRWEEARRYLDVLAEASDRVSLRRYGETYESRPLMVAVVTSAANQARLDEIRRDRLRLADPRTLSDEERRRLERDTPVVVWLGYGIHGNETSSTEAALATAYALAAAEGAEWEARLSRAVVIIDPLMNPDGRERYLAAYQQRRGREPDPRPQAAEHREPWPGGRGNHYLFDLNRDWAWATQRETRQRLTEYRRWEPQVFVDLHEMNARSEYFFPPPTEPVHPAIAPTVLRWLDRFGRANAAAFDRAGWLYFKAEAFDLFYPGYGDSYPSLRGAVGMTYEVGGGGRAGEALRLPDGSVLTLASRAARHFTSSLATVAAAADGQVELNRDFVAARTPEPSAETTYLWSADAAEAVALVELLRVHGIEVARLSQETSLPLAALGTDRGAESTNLPAGTWAATTAQPLGRLVEALMEPRPALPDAWLERQRHRAEHNLSPEFFDITGWSLPLAFGVDAWAHRGTPKGLETVRGELHSGGLGAGPAAGGDRAVGYLIPWHGLAGYRLAADLLEEGVALRLALTPVGIAGTTAPPGVLFAPARGAPDDLGDRLATAMRGHVGDGPQPVHDTYGESGTSLGSDRVPRLRPSRVGLLGGRGVRSTSFGSLWHLFDRTLRLPVARLDTGRLSADDLSELDALVLPEGQYGTLSESATKALVSWVRDGGTLVAVGRAQAWLAEQKLSALERWPPAGGNGEDTPKGENDEKPPRGAARRLLFTPGAVVAGELSAGHPLAAGLPAAPPMLFWGDTVWRATGDPQRDVLTAPELDPVVAGFTWPEGRQHLAGALLVASEPAGRGRVVLFAQDPTFRGFWRSTMPLLLNAVIYGPSGTLDAAAGG